MLIAIQNPINRFCDDFASPLLDEPAPNAKSDISFAINECEEIEGYEIKRLLGSGGEATVHEALDKKTNQFVAFKHYNQVKNMGNGMPREVEISNMFNHPHILKIIDCFIVNNEYIVVLPLSKGGALESSDVPGITITGGIQLLSQIGSALACMHAHGIVHRDVKPANILLFETGYILCDFSISVQVHDDDEMISGVFGTKYFMAPEISNNRYKPKPTDMWSLGVTVFVLLYGQYPYNLQSKIEKPEANVFTNLARNVLNEDLIFPDVPVIPLELKTIISRLLDKNPLTRITADELIHDPWILGKVDGWARLLELIQNPNL